MRLSLIVVYRNREAHLRSQISWWNSYNVNGNLSEYEMIIVEADDEPSQWIKEEIVDENIRYHFLYCNGILHKTKALNLGLCLSQGFYIAPLDVDLIPVGNALEEHLKLAESSPNCLVTGYRLMSELTSIAPKRLAENLSNSSVAPEDMPTALIKHLVDKERFGVLPLFRRNRLVSLGGWDENFVGWGAEDQDLLERYLRDDIFLCRCPDLVYLHLHHGSDSEWREASLVENNRTYYYYKKSMHNIRNTSSA